MGEPTEKSEDVESSNNEGNGALLAGKEVTGPGDELLCGIISISKDLHNLKKGYTHTWLLWS